MANAQGAIELTSAPTAGTCRGQGATEYLVLLAVVLIVALVSVALLGFFPGMASDAQITQSQAYWKGASPVAIIEMSAKDSGYLAPPGDVSYPYLRLRNTGAYPIRITKLLGAGAQNRTQFHNGTAWVNISDYYYMGPGEEKHIGVMDFFNLPTQRDAAFGRLGGARGDVLNSATQMCEQPGAATKGSVVVNEFGFEYIEYIEGQQITKRQVGKPLIIRCI